MRSRDGARLHLAGALTPGAHPSARARILHAAAVAREAVVLGLSDDPAALVPGDVFICRLSFDLEQGIIDRHDLVG